MSHYGKALFFVTVLLLSVSLANTTLLKPVIPDVEGDQPLIRAGILCSTVETAEQKFNKSDVVFFGQVIGFGNVTESYEGHVKFNVINKWKGVTTNEVIVRVYPQPEGAGPKFQIGDKELVYASYY